MLLMYADPAKERLKRSISPRTRASLRRRQARLRWLHKYRRARAFGRSMRHEPLTLLRFVLLDPEVENFTYDIANEEELIGFVAGALNASTQEIAGYVDEARADPELNSKLSRRLRWRWDSKRRMPLGRRLAYYAIARHLRPRTVVETGILAGLGSLVVLRALERNRDEGAPGELISVDLLPGTGWLVPDHLRAHWKPVYESTFTALDRLLDGRRVDMLIQDLGSGYEAELHDYETVVRHGSDRLVLVAASAHLTPALSDFAASRGLPCSYFSDAPREHVAPGAVIGVAVLGSLDLEQ